MPQEGSIVRNKRTGAMGRIVNGQVVPLDAQAPAAPMGDPIVKPAPTPKPVDPLVQESRQLDIALKRKQLNKPDAPAGPTGKATDAKAQAKLANLEALTTQINRVQQLYNETLKDNTIPVLGSVAEYLPTQDNARFDSAAAGMAEQGLAAFRVPGVGAQSDTELKQFVEANKPSTWSMDSSNEERLRQLRNRVDETRKALGLPPAQWEGVNDDEGLSGRVTYEGPNPANNSKTPADIEAIMAKYGAR